MLRIKFAYCLLFRFLVKVLFWNRFFLWQSWYFWVLLIWQCQSHRLRWYCYLLVNLFDQRCDQNWPQILLSGNTPIVNHSKISFRFGVVSSHLSYIHQSSIFSLKDKNLAKLAQLYENREFLERWMKSMKKRMSF